MSTLLLLVLLLTLPDGLAAAAATGFSSLVCGEVIEAREGFRTC